jgi:two-component system, chemotaxis family, protein-glutamate methylesterase/glutaminase
MAQRDIVVIGGSAGSLDAMQQILQVLPADLPAALFVIMHVTPSVKSYLVQIFGRRAQMAVWEAADGDRIEHGRVYVAQPDRHLAGVQ